MKTKTSTVFTLNLLSDRGCVRGGGTSRRSLKLADVLRLVPHHPHTAAVLFAIAFGFSAQAQSGRQATAIWLRDSGKVGLLSSDPYGDHASCSRRNMEDTARCQTAQTSARSDVGVQQVWLHTGMLSTMKTLASTYNYSYFAGFIAGGDHSAGSYHYSGTAQLHIAIAGEGPPGIFLAIKRQRGPGIRRHQFGRKREQL